MRKSILLAMLLLPFLAATTYAGKQVAFDSESGDSWGVDAFGGGSYLGVDTRDVTRDRLGDLKLKEERGVEVTMVDQDAPAGKAGIKEHDVILNVNGTDLQSVEQLRRMIHEIPPGRTVTLGVSRDGQPMTVKVELADRKKAFFYSSGPEGKEFKFKMPEVSIPPIPPIDVDIPASIVVVHTSVRSGLMMENLTPQLGDYFGVKDGHGVLVRSVEKGSRAEKAGFRAGDVIIRVNGETITDAGDFSHAVRSRSESTATVGIVRDKKEQTLTLSLPERNHSHAIDESLDVPDADAAIDLSELAEGLAELQTAEVQRIEPELQRKSKEYRIQQQEFKKQMREMQREWRSHQDEIQKEIELELQDESTRI
jgi:serine protease Do